MQIKYFNLELLWSKYKIIFNIHKIYIRIVFEDEITRDAIIYLSSTNSYESIKVRLRLSLNSIIKGCLILQHFTSKKLEYLQTTFIKQFEKKFGMFCRVHEQLYATHVPHTLHI